MSDIIPVKVRTARKRHVCDDCREWIEPGERYELSVTPPRRLAEYFVDRWLTWRSHYPRNAPGSYLLGCALSAGFRENAERDAQQVAA